MPSPADGMTMSDGDRRREILRRYGYAALGALVLSTMIFVASKGAFWDGSNTFFLVAIVGVAVLLPPLLYVSVRTSGPAAYSVDGDGLMLWFPGYLGSRSVLTPWTAIVGATPLGRHGREIRLTIRFPERGESDMAPFAGRKVTVRVSSDDWGRISDHLAPNLRKAEK